MYVPRKFNHAKRHELKKSAVRQGELQLEWSCTPVSAEEFERIMRTQGELKELKDGETPQLGVWYKGW